MRICFYNLTAGLTLGGLETHNWELGFELTKRGHEVVIVSGCGSRIRRPGIQLVEFPFVSRERFTWLPNLKPGFRNRYRKLLERLSFGRHAISFLKTHEIDVVVVSKPFDFPVLWRARRQGVKARTVFTSGGTDFFIGDRMFRRAVDYWIGCSNSNAEQIRKRFGRPVTVSNYGVDIELFRRSRKEHGRRRTYNIPLDVTLLLSVGRIVHWKGLQVAIATLKELPETHMAIVGRGPYRNQLEAFSRRMSLQGRVHFLGSVDHSNLPQLFSMADLFVQPSIGNEAFGITLIEAMASGLPVLGSDRGGIPEVIEDGRTGLILPPGDIPAWTEAIKKVTDDPAKMEKMGSEGRCLVERRFSWARSADRFEALLAGDR